MWGVTANGCQNGGTRGIYKKLKKTAGIRNGPDGKRKAAGCQPYELTSCPVGQGPTLLSFQGITGREEALGSDAAPGTLEWVNINAGIPTPGPSKPRGARDSGWVGSQRRDSRAAIHSQIHRWHPCPKQSGPTRYCPHLCWVSSRIVVKQSEL